MFDWEHDGMSSALQQSTVSQAASITCRLVQCCVGVAVAGVAFALMFKSGLGLGPWEVLADGIHRQTQLAVGTSAMVVSCLALLCWVPLRQRPGIGTAVSVALFGTVTNVAMTLLPTISDAALQGIGLFTSVAVWGFGIALYISAGLGPGPRDGIMTGLARRGHSVRYGRTLTEVAVLLLGTALGGGIGPGTIAFALLIGPCIQASLRALEELPKQLKGRTSRLSRSCSLGSGR